MPDKTLSKVVVPDVILNSYRPLLARTWDLAIAGWAVALWVYCIGSLIIRISFSFKYGITFSFSNVPVILLGTAVTIVAATAVSRRRDGAGTSGGPLLGSAFVLFAGLGALAIVVGVIGFFVSFSLPASKLATAVQNLAGVIMGLVVIIWALGEMASRPKATAGAKGGKGLEGLVEGFEGTNLEGLVPTALSSRKETASSWEIVALGWVVAVWVYGLDALFSQAASTAEHAALGLLVLGGPIAVFGLTVAVRLRAAQSNPMGRFCLDLAMLLASAFGPTLAVVGVIEFIHAFTINGFGNVVGTLVESVAAVLIGLLILLWGLGEIGFIRNLGAATTATVVPAWGAGSAPMPPTVPTAPPAPGAGPADPSGTGTFTPEPPPAAGPVA